MTSALRSAVSDALPSGYLSARLGDWTLPTDRSAIMAIVNITPDSFSDGGSYVSVDDIAKRIESAIESGADILDFGAESTRPGAVAVDTRDQLERLAPVFDMLADISIPVSIDTRSAVVAERCLYRGFEIVNDVSCGRYDPNMPTLVAEADCVLVAMHSRGTPESMSSLARYDNPIVDVFSEWQACARKFFDAGCRTKNVWFDPGLGFAKDVEHCWKILAALFEKLGPEVETVIGASRKRFVDVSAAPPEARDSASNAVIAIMANAKRFVFRVHDVAGARQSVLVASALARVRHEAAA